MDRRDRSAKTADPQSAGPFAADNRPTFTFAENDLAKRSERGDVKGFRALERADVISI